MTTNLRPLALVVVLSGLVAVIHAESPQAETVVSLLSKAGAYIADYERLFAAVTAEEQYVQTMRKAAGRNVFQVQSRRLRSDVVVINAGDDAWAVFRDVLEVDGQRIKDHDARLQKLFLDTPTQAVVQAQKIADESARYNLGSVRRNINVPTMALTYLRAANQARSKFVAMGRENLENLSVNVLGFTEVASPTIIRSGNKDLQATGRFWIDPSSGRVVKSELCAKPAATDTKIVVTYAPTDPLPMWLPVTMDEEYNTSSGVERITARASYSNFHQFKVSTSIKHD